MSRNSVLNDRHRALGSKLDGEKWNGMPIPWSYNTDVNDEVIAVRSRAALYDISALNVVKVYGNDAERLIDYLLAKDITRLRSGHSLLSAILTEDGGICDDIMVIRDSDTEFRLSHGGGDTKQSLARLASGFDVTVEPDTDVHILSLQGPKSLEVLARLVDVDLKELQYFQHVESTIFGKKVYIARGGYSGELGYELYCKAADTVLIWDELLKAGADWGVIPASWNSLELTRIEAGLSFYPYEMPEGDTTPWEVNMGWGVDVDKPGEYCGKAAVMARYGKQRVAQIGLIAKSSKALSAGDHLVINGQQVGVVTSAAYSNYLMQSLALAHIKPEFADKGTNIIVQNASGNIKAYVATLPFYDPLRLRTHPRAGA